MKHPLTMQQRDYVFEAHMQVRDYECDMEGIVNNAVYMNYAEHTRHLFLKACGLSFAEMHRRGTDAVVARADMQFKVPLRADDEFVSRLALTIEGVRYVFWQDIYRAADDRLCFRCRTEVVCLVNGRLARSPEYDEALEKYAKKPHFIEKKS